MPYDQLLKELLRAFFAPFVRRFFPDVAAQLQLEDVIFLDKELATEMGRGTPRALDLVARVPTRAGTPKLILIHVEFEARRRRRFPVRMFDYYWLLRRRYRVPVLPVVVYVHGGRDAEDWEYYREEALGEEVVRFRFRQLRLSALSAEEAVREGEPWLSALATLMDRRGTDLAVLKVTCLRDIGQARLRPEEQQLLVNVVETFLQLEGAVQEEFRRLLAREEEAMARRVQMTWADEMEEKGLLRGKREDVVKILRVRFGPVPEDLERRISAISVVKELDRLLERSLSATNLEEVSAALPA